MLTPADERYHIDKHAFKTPFVCGARNLGEALRRIGEGAAMIRTKARPAPATSSRPSGTRASAPKNIRRVQSASGEELMTIAKELGAPYELVKEVRRTGELPVVNFAAGGVATPADAALMMQLGARASSSVRASSSRTTPLLGRRPSSEAVANYKDPDVLARVSRGLWGSDVLASRSANGQGGKAGQQGLVTPQSTASVEFVTVG